LYEKKEGYTQVFLSRIIEKDKKAVSVIRENLDNTGLSDRAEVFMMDVLSAVPFLSGKKARFDLIFIGAPYTIPILGPTLEKLSKSDIIDNNSIIIAEHSKRQKIDREYGCLKLIRQEQYGDTVFSFYKGEIIEDSGLPGQF